jgi:hypothetical protein
LVVAERRRDPQAVGRQLGERERAPVGGAGASIRQFGLFRNAAQPRAGGGADFGEQGIRCLEHRRPAEHRRAGRKRAIALVEKRC